MSDSVRENVRRYYAERARTSSSCCEPVVTSCCEPSVVSCCGPEALYPADLLTGLPEEALLSLGCGNPLVGADLKPGETVLDLGSGGGLDCFLAVRQVGPTGRVIGVDMTPEMVERATTAARQLGLSNVEFRLGYLEDLPVEDESVDVVISNCVINLSPDKPRVFREMFRVLKPGGRVSIADMVSKGPLPQSLRESPEAWNACIGGALEMEEYVHALEEAGFTEVEIRTVNTPPLSTLPEGTVFSALITARKP
ncbi:MAG: arsenite methyltransferase [Anaerolineae bacterium]|nr:arsenite methyltransferase [Anaerolineae bacterium]MDW7992595.1 arsenite methyltransferase [Anaerolineae bacterium]